MTHVAQALCCVVLLCGCDPVPSSQAQPSVSQSPLSPSATVAVSTRPEPPDTRLVRLWKTLDEKLATNTTPNAFEALDLISAEGTQHGGAPEIFCYEALAFYSLNQISAGSVESQRCLSRLPNERRASWKARLDNADAAANARVIKAVAQAATDKCTAVLDQQTGVGSCSNCVRVNDVKSRLESLKASDDPSVVQLTRKMLQRDKRADPQRYGDDATPTQPARPRQ